MPADPAQPASSGAPDPPVAATPAAPATPAEVERISAVQDVVLRNVMITQCYHDLARAVRQRAGEGANWCAFATWASRQAGHTIRGEDLEDVLRARLGDTAELREAVATLRALSSRLAIRRPLADPVGAVLDALDPGAAARRAAAAVAAGNRKVFAEIGREFARFLEALSAGDPEAPRRFLEALRPGDPPDGQGMLRQAFALMLGLAGEVAGPPRAERLYFANILIGAHEQTRLQPEIAAAMNAAFDEDDLRDRVLRLVLPGFWLRLRYRLAALFGRRPPLDEALARLAAGARSELRRLLTAQVMTLALPDLPAVRLGQDVVGVHAPSLARITDAGLEALLRRIDPGETTVASGTVDWSVLEQRLRFIAELFRCYHEAPQLFAAPYTAAQLARLRAGLLPDPPL